MRPGIAAAAALVAAVAGAALGVQLSILFSSLGGTAPSPWGELEVATVTCLAAAAFVGGLSVLFAVGAVRRLAAFAQGRGMLRLMRDLPPIAGIAVALGLLAGPALLGEGAVRTPPPQQVSPPHEYDHRLTELEATLLRAIAARTEPDACPAPPTPAESGCDQETRRVMTHRRAWMNSNLAHTLDCDNPTPVALGFDRETAGAVAVDQAQICDPTTPFALQIRASAYKTCYVLPSTKSRKVLESLRQRLGTILADSVEFVGHTDGADVGAGGCVADDGTRVTDNWHLSALRAVHARAAFASATQRVIIGPVGPVDVLLPLDVEDGPPPVGIRIVPTAVGVAAERPVIRTPTESDKEYEARNRRVTVIIKGRSLLNLDPSKCLEARP